MNYWTEACAGNDTGDLPLPLPPPTLAQWRAGLPEELREPICPGPGRCPLCRWHTDD